MRSLILTLILITPACLAARTNEQGQTEFVTDDGTVIPVVSTTETIGNIAGGMFGLPGIGTGLAIVLGAIGARMAKKSGATVT